MDLKFVATNLFWIILLIYNVKASSDSHAHPVTTTAKVVTTTATSVATTQDPAQIALLFGATSPTFFLQTKNVKYDYLKFADFSIVILDPQLSQEEIATLKADNKTVLAHISVGKADSEKPYWRSEWSEKTPDFVVGQDDEVANHYFVRFWRLYWRRLISKYVKDVMNLGYSGVFLDNVDVYRLFNKTNAGTTGLAEMLDLLHVIRDQVLSVDPKGKVFVSNTPELYKEAKFRDTVDGLAVKNIWFVNDTERNKTEVDNIIADVKAAQRDGKAILSYNFVNQSDNSCIYYGRCFTEKFYCLVTDEEGTGETRKCTRKPVTVITVASTTTTTATKKLHSGSTKSFQSANLLLLFSYFIVIGIQNVV